MAMRPKRATAPLNSKLRSHLRGDDTAGRDLDPTTLGGSLLFDFDYDRNWAAGLDPHDPADGEGSPSPAPIPSAAMIHDLMNPVFADRFRRSLISDVAAAADRLGALRSDGPALRRAVVRSLRESGYDAGICRSLPDGGGHEYIDVVRLPPSSARYVVDLDFAAEFELARPTVEYGNVAAELPEVYVGRAEELRSALRVMAEAAKRSLAARGMHVPPWRKGKYLRAKWLGSHRRTTVFTPPPQPSGCASFRAASLDAECHAVGFQPVAPLLAIS